MEASVDEVTLRTFRAGDIDALKQIDAEFVRELGLEEPIRRRTDFADIEGVYFQAGGAFWVIEARSGEVVGYGGVLRVDNETARLRHFRVREEWRRRGLATRLLLEAERFCAERGYRRVTLATTDKQQAAQALYRKHGYVPEGEHWLTPELREIEFVKELA